jgi:hypothetical protein
MITTWTVLDDTTGAIKISITADTDARGIVIEKTPNWHTYHEVENVISILATANAWLLDNGGVV